MLIPPGIPMHIKHDLFGGDLHMFGDGADFLKGLSIWPEPNLSASYLCV